MGAEVTEMWAGLRPFLPRPAGQVWEEAEGTDKALGGADVA